MNDSWLAELWKGALQRSEGDVWVVYLTILQGQYCE
jgi:hypothetical protein